MSSAKVAECGAAILSIYVGRWRASTSIARLWHSQGRNEDAMALLNPAYREFTEGHDLEDLKEARALLDQLTD